ncbi:MAG: NAD(P)-binding domain-containing protein [Acidobacteriota bacterium]|nr:NAD(P)-binding domain-containing protein [Acidobacteriota bacterium]
MDTLLTAIIAGVVLGFFCLRYWIAERRKARLTQEATANGPLFSEGPRAQHPLVHIDSCIGCGACVTACPEGDVLALVNGKAAIIHAHKCIGHSLCAEACPVEAITMVNAKASASADHPRLTEEHETSVPNLFIAGELGGLALIKNAVNQGRECVDTVHARIDALRATLPSGDLLDVLIIGAGPAGISASLRAHELGLKSLTLERESVGGTVAKYPRQKLVMTSPVEFPQYGKFRKTQLSKEELLAFWQKVIDRVELNIHTGVPVTGVTRCDDGSFLVTTPQQSYRSRSVLLALGISGEPRKLGVPGEDLPHVLYRLIEADHYKDTNILVIGGGDSAVEAALGLARQQGNRVTLSYRGSEFTRIKDRNRKRLTEQLRSDSMRVLFNSSPVEFRSDSALLQVGETQMELPAEHVWIFAGGTSPKEFLKAAGVAFGESA